MALLLKDKRDASTVTKTIYSEVSIKVTPSGPSWEIRTLTGY